MEKFISKSSSIRNKEYDSIKRSRNFQENWRNHYPWIGTETKHGKVSTMFCTPCRAYTLYSDAKSPLVIGTDRFRVDPIKTHGTSGKHLFCYRKYSKAKGQTSSSPPSGSTNDRPSEHVNSIVRAVRKVEHSQMEKLRKLFRTSYNVAFRLKPFTDFEWLCKMQISNGIDLGKNYQNSEGCRTFTHFIAENMRKAVKHSLQNTRFFCVLSDGSTDCAVIEQESVKIRFLDQESKELVTKSANLIALEGANADKTFGAVKQALQDVGIQDLSNNKPTLVGANFDGASVNMGINHSVSSLLKDILPQIIVVHCVAHKLELGIMDSVKDMTYISTFEDVIKRIYRFYSMSPKRKREVQLIAEVLDITLCRFGTVKQVRWVSSKLCAVKAVIRNYPALVMHLEHASNSKTAESVKAKALLKEVTTSKFVKFMHTMLDYLTLVTRTSCLFQSDDLLLVEVPKAILDLINDLKLLKVQNGPSQTEFAKCYDTESKLYKDKVSLTGPAVSLCPTDDMLLGLLVDQTVKYLQKRFQSFYDGETPQHWFGIFDFTTWPVDQDELLVYGNIHIQKLVAHFGYVLSEGEQDEIVYEWGRLKSHINAIRTQPLSVVYFNLLKLAPPRLKNIIILVELMCTLSPGTASCERHFSAMNNVKSSTRSCLSQTSLQDLLRICTDGVDPDQFNPDEAIGDWLTDTPGSRHVHGHSMPTRITPQ